jgi:hypothetical protein
MEGDAGERCSFALDDCLENPLGAWGIEVEARDEYGHVRGEGRVRNDGTFSVTVPPGVSLDINFRLRYCTSETCFLFSDAGKIYGLSHPEKKIVASQKEGIALAPMLFQEESVAAGVPNNHAHAANHFASLMELSFLWHGIGGASFYVDDFAPLTILLPTTLDTSGRTTGPSTVHISENTGGWIKGNKIMHEYGHVLSLRAWGGRYWFDGEPFAEWSATTPQEPHIAFKEGFANFVTRSAETAQSCSGSFDTSESEGGEEDGLLYPRNVTKFLCDLFDYHTESEGDDSFHHKPSFFLDILSDILKRSQRLDDRTLSICTFIETFASLDERDPTEVAKMYVLGQHNNIFCP